MYPETKAKEVKVSILLDLGVPFGDKEKISSAFSAKWKVSNIRYLGVMISASLSNVYLLEHNIIPMFNWIQSQLETWSKWDWSNLCS